MSDTGALAPHPSEGVGALRGAHGLRAGGRVAVQGPQVTDTDWFANQIRMLRVMAPQLEREPEVLAQLATSPVDAETLARQTAAYTGLYTADQLARQIVSLPAPAQRVVWAQLTKPQQTTLAGMGYSPPHRERQMIGSIPGLGGVGRVAGTMFEGFHKALGTVIDPALELVKDIGEIPSEVYRTIRQLPPEMQQIALLAAIAGAVALPAAAPAVAGVLPGLAATGMAAGMASASTVGFGALGGAAVGGFLAATVLTPGDNEFIDAWHLANTGESVFTTDARRRASRQLGEDPNLDSLAASLAMESGYDVAAAFAGIPDADDARNLQGQIAVIAERAGAQGTPEFQAAYDLLEKLSTQVAFKGAIKTLQQGKISFGRDVARTVGLTPNTMAYDLVSGGFDAAFVLGLDPTIAATKFLRIGRAVRFGVFPDASMLRMGEEAAPYTQRILEVATADTVAGRDVRRAFEVMADGMNSNRWEQVMAHLLPAGKRFRGGLARFGADPENKVGAVWTVDDVRHYFESSIGAADMLTGRGASWQKGAIEIPHVGRYGLKLREAKLWGARQINFADELNIGRRHLELTDRLKANIPQSPGRLDMERFAPAAVLPGYAEAAVTPTALRKEGEVADAAGISLGGGRMGALTDVQPPVPLTVIAGIPVIGAGVRQFATLAKTLAERIPTNRYMAISDSGPRGAGFVDDARAFTELFRSIGTPGPVRRAWFNTIVDARSLAARQLAVRAATKTMLDAAGVGASKEGQELMAMFTQKMDQRFLEVTTDIELAPGLTTKSSVFPGAQDSVFLAIPTFRDLRTALAHETLMSKLLNYADSRPVEATMARIWKPAVLLRLGFIPRAAGDELLAFLATHGLGAYARTFVERAAAQDDEDLLVHANILQQNFVNPINWMASRVSGGRADGLDEIGTALLLRYSQWVRGALRQGWQPEGPAMAAIRDKVLAPHSMRRALFGGVNTDELRRAGKFAEMNASGTIPELAAGNSGMAATTVNDLQRLAQVDARNNPIEDIAIRTRTDVWHDYDQNSPRYREGLVRRASQAVDNDAFVPGTPVFDYVFHDPGTAVLADLGPDAGGILDRHAAIGREAGQKGLKPLRDMIAQAGYDNLTNVNIILDNLPADHWLRQELIDNDLVPLSTDTAQGWLTKVAHHGGAPGELAATIAHHFDSPRTRHYLTMTGASGPEHWRGYRIPLDDDFAAGMTRAGVQQASDPEHADAWMGNMGAVVGRGSIPVIDPPREGTARFWVPVVDGDAIASMQSAMGRILAEVDEDEWVPYLTNLLRESSEAAGDVVVPSSYRVAARVMADVAALPPRHLTAYGLEQADERAVRLTTSAMSSAATARDVGRVLNRFGLGDDFDPDAALLAYVDVGAHAGHRTTGPFDDTIGDRVIDYGEGVWGRRISPSHEAIPVPEPHIEVMDDAGNPAISVGTVLTNRATQVTDEFRARGTVGFWAHQQAQAEAMSDEWFMASSRQGPRGSERLHQWDDSATGLPREEWGADHFNDKIFDSLGRLQSTKLGEMKVVKGPIVGDIPIGVASDGTITVDMEYMRFDSETGSYLAGQGKLHPPGEAGDEAADAAGITGIPDVLSQRAAAALAEFGIDVGDVLAHADTPVKYATLLTNYVHLALVTHSPTTAMGLALSGMGFPLPTKAERFLARMAPGSKRTQVMWEMMGPALHDKMMKTAGTPLLHREKRRYGILNRQTHEESRVIHTLNEAHANGLDKIDLPPVVHLPDEQTKKLMGWDRIVEKGFRQVIGPAIDVIVRKPVAFHNYMEASAMAEAYYSTWLPGHLFGGLYEYQGRMHRLNPTRPPEVAEASYIRSQLTDLQAGAGPEAVWARQNLRTSALFGADGMPSAYAEKHWDEIQGKLTASTDPAAADLKTMLDRFVDDPVDYPAPVDGSYRKVVHRLRINAEQPLQSTGAELAMVRKVGQEAGLIGPGGTTEQLLAAYFDDIRGNAQILEQTAQRLGYTHDWARVAPRLPTSANWAKVSDERVMAQQLANEWKHWRKHEERYQSLLAMVDAPFFDEAMADELARLGGERPFWLNQLTDNEIGTVADATRSYEKMWDHSHNVAQERAIAETIPFVDSDGIRSQFQEYVRNLSPFLFAEDQFIRRWGRTVRIAPDTMRKGQLLMNGLRSAGIVQKDQFGNEVFVYPGSATFTAFLAKVPFVPLTLPVASMMTGQVKYMLPGLDNYGMPSGSPLLTIPMGFVTQHFPELQPIHDKFTGERGQRAGIIRSLVPTSVMRFYDAILGDEDSNRRLASAMMSAMQVAEANGWSPAPDASATEVEQYMDKVRATARVMLFSQAMAGFVVPSSPGTALAGDPDMPGASGSGLSFDSLTGLNFTPASLNSEFIELVHNLGIEDGTLRFLERYPDTTPDDLFNSNLAYSTRQTDTPAGAPIPTHRSAWEFYEDNRDYFAPFEYAGAYLLPPGRTPEEVADRPDSVHADQLAAGLRTRNTPENLYGDLKWAAAAPVYFDGLARYQELSERPLSPEERATAKAGWDAWKNDFFRTHPLFSERLQSGEGRIRRKQTIAELRVVLRDPEGPLPWHAPAMAELLQAWDGWQNSRRALSGSRTARSIRARDNLDRDWSAWVEEYIRRHPEASTLWGAVLRPESGDYGSGLED